jgi:SAM-dependent methyltransferase
MPASRYLMESEEEIQRLEMKTRRSVVRDHAVWAGLAPGHRVADIGCGPGKTTAQLCELAGPGGEAVGIDASAPRIGYARRRYGQANLDFVCRDILEPLDDLGPFDFIWVRFVLEYYRSNSLDILKNLARILKPGGILCLVDIDNSCLCHHGLPDRLARTIQGIMHILETEENFDPYAGRRLYGYLYDLGFHDMNVQLTADHLIYGEISETDEFNLRHKIEMSGRLLAHRFAHDYPGGGDAFLDEFNAAVADKRRFIYAPLISCRGRKPETA